MERQILDLLAGTQASGADTRLAAERQLKELDSNDAFPGALVTIGAHSDVSVADRQAALIQLKLFVGRGWSSTLDDEFGGTVLVSDGVKIQIRDGLLAIVFSNNVDSKVLGQAAAVVTKIAKADFPEAWPSLLDTLLNQQEHSSDGQTGGILTVLMELVQGGLDEEEFYHYASKMLQFFHGVAVDNTKALLVRAQAISVFRQCFDFVETLKYRDDLPIKAFVQDICNAWSPFFKDALNEELPTFPTAEQDSEADNDVVRKYRGVVALKIQVILTLTKIQYLFPDLLAAQEFFTATWNALQAHEGTYYSSYVNGNKEGSLITITGLPFTMDSLVIEQLDFLQSLLDSPQVKAQFETMMEADHASGGNAIGEWIMSVMGALVTYASITAESEGLWEIDYNVFLSEETFAETNNTPRSSSAGFAFNLCTWLPEKTLESILGYMKLIWEDAHPSWRHKEAALYVLQQIVEEHKNEDRPVHPDAVGPCVEYVASTMNDGSPLLRARGHIVMAAVLTVWVAQGGTNPEMVSAYAQQSLNAMGNDESDIVKASCIRLMSTYLLAIPKPLATTFQVPVVTAITSFLTNQDMEDMDENVDLVDAVLQTLRDLIMANPETCLDHDALDVMLGMVKLGAARDETTYILIEEAFESAAQAMANEGVETYNQLCYKVLPSLVSAMEVQDENDKEKVTAQVDISLNLIKLLAASAVNSLPDGFIAATMPKLCRIILSDADFYLHQQATLAIKEILSNDHARVFAWVDPEFQKGGLDMILLIIGHLLGPQVDDASAAEVGDLAVEVVEKAGPDALGASMRELLQVVVVRLSTAEHPGLIQSLVLVFARLSLISAQDVLNFLAELQIGDRTGLDVVVTKWLENSTIFVGFQAVRQNVMALTTIYSLHDTRFAGIQVKGDMIVDYNTTRIKTRSLAKAAPIQYTVIGAELKLIKLLVNELVPNYTSGSPVRGYGFAVVDAAPRVNSEGSWESASGGTVSRGSPTKADDETQKYLIDFFTGIGAEARFQQLYGELTDEEQKRLMGAVEDHQLQQAQQASLAGH